VIEGRRLAGKYLRGGLIVFLAQAVVVVWGARAYLQQHDLTDFRCFWSAGVLVSSGQSPYDVALLARVQQQYGWDKATTGGGLYDLQPFYYPPWFALFCAVLVPLGYHNAQLAWLVGSFELLVVCGILLRRVLGEVPPLISIVMVPAFGFSVLCALMGQLTPIILFSVVVAWRLLEGGWDRVAGMVLVGATIKPDRAALLVLALFLWSASRRRWGMIQGFMAALVVLSLASAFLWPTWPMQMLQSTRDTPLPTEFFPWIGTTWLLVLKTLRLRGWSLWAAYLVVALPFAAVMIGTALRRSSSLADVLAVSLLAFFFVAPYSQPYDFPLLLIPLLVLVGHLRTQLARMALILPMTFLPYLHFAYVGRMRLGWIPELSPAPKVTLFWVPLLLACLWISSKMRGPAPAPREGLLSLSES